MKKEFLKDENGNVIGRKRGLWGTKGGDEDYPQYAIFGKWIHYPCID